MATLAKLCKGLRTECSPNTATIICKSWLRLPVIMDAARHLTFQSSCTFSEGQVTVLPSFNLSDLQRKGHQREVK